MKINWDNKHNRGGHIEIDDYMSTSMPEWYKNSTMFVEGAKTLRELVAKKFQDFLDGIGSNKTVRACPAYINFAKQSFALKNAADIFIRITYSKDMDDWTYEWRSEDKNISMAQHAAEQFPGFSDDNMLLKFAFNFCIVPSENTQMSYVDPYIANPVHYRVSPGIIQLKKGVLVGMDMPVFFPKVEEEYWIPAGSTLGYVQFDKKVNGLKHKDLSKEREKKIYKTFVKGDHSDYISK